MVCYNFINRYRESMKRCIFVIAVLFLAHGCTILENSTHRDLADGSFIMERDGRKHPVFADVEEDTINIFQAHQMNGRLLANETSASQFFPAEIADTTVRGVTLNRYSFDIDFLTVPAKFRLSRSNVPAQLNAEMNGMIYLGYRRDKYVIDYHNKPTGHSERQIKHFGYSAGFFTGVGNTFISPTTTSDMIQKEYDGIVWSKGVAGIVAVNQFTLGVALGFDNLLDENKSVWIYETRPWMGFVIGLNLN